MEFLLRHGVNPQLALETATNLAIHLAEPILGQIQPYDLGAFALDSKVALEYCRRIINPADKSRKTQRGVNPKILVEAYPAHAFVIDFEEVRELHFAVSLPEPAIDALFDELRPLLDSLDEYIGIVP